MNESEQTDDLDKVGFSFWSDTRLILSNRSRKLSCDHFPQDIVFACEGGHCCRVSLQPPLAGLVWKMPQNKVSLCTKLWRQPSGQLLTCPGVPRQSRLASCVRFPPWFPHVQAYGDDAGCSALPQGNHVLAPTALSQHFTLLQSRIATQLPVWGLLQLCVTPKCPYDSWHLVGHPARHGWRDDVPMLFLEQEELPGTGFLSNGNFFLPSRYICSGGKGIVFLEGREPVLLKSFALAVSY